MKNFKEFIKDYEDGNFTYSDKTLAYAAYCQGYAEGMKENLNNMLSAPITMPDVSVPYPYTQVTWDMQAQLLHEEAEKMQVYPEQLKKEYPPEELKEIKKAMMMNLSEEERQAEFARQVEELKQNPDSVLNALAMQKAAEKSRGEVK